MWKTSHIYFVENEKKSSNLTVRAARAARLFAVLVPITFVCWADVDIADQDRSPRTLLLQISRRQF